MQGPPPEKGKDSTQSQTTTIPSSRAPTRPHLIFAVATLRSPAAPPRLLGRRAFRLEGRATLAVTQLDEAGWAGPLGSPTPLRMEQTENI